MPFVTHADVGVDGGGGVASNFDDFVRNKLATFMCSTTLFAAGNNWTRSKADVNIAANEYEVFLTPPSGRTAGVDKPPFLAIHTRPEGAVIFPWLSFDGARPAYDQTPAAPWIARISGANPDFQVNDVNPEHGAPTMSNCGAGPYLAHYLFAPANGRYCYAAIQIATRKWRHFWVGNLDKYVSFTGGEFCGATYWLNAAAQIDDPYNARHSVPGDGISRPLNGANATVFRCVGANSVVDANAAQSWWGSDQNTPAVSVDGDLFTNNRPTGAGYSNVNNTSGAKRIGAACYTGRGNTYGTTMFQLEPSLLSNAKPLVPIMAFARSSFDGLVRPCPVGEFPDVFRINMKGYSPSQSITLGSDTYRLFPLINSDTVNTLVNEEYSGYEGYAYRVTP